MKEFGRLFLVNKHVMELDLDIATDTEKIVQFIAKDFEKLKAVSSISGFASLIRIKKLGLMIEQSDPIEADFSCTQLMLIASDLEVHGHDAVVESARVLMQNAEVTTPALFALGFEYDEIEKISKMNKDEINRNIESLLKEKSLIS
jgi:hypothetical protein